MGTAMTNRPRISTPKKAATRTPASKKPAKPNASILSFFKKAEAVEDTLFVGPAPKDILDEEDIYGNGDDVDEDRYNEDETPFKKRKLNHRQDETSNTNIFGATENLETKSEKTSAQSKPVRRKGPFLDDSDSDEEDGESPRPAKTPIRESEPNLKAFPNAETPDTRHVPKEQADNDIPPLKHEDSTFPEFDNFEDFGDLDEFEDGDMLGEEYREMRFMQEQARLEAEAEGSGDYSCDDTVEPPFGDDAMTEKCPICNGDLASVSPDDATRHVNACLDGKPTPLPKYKEEASVETPKVEAQDIAKRFAKAAIARPGQANPFNMNGGGSSSASAFTKLMSGHAENSAWANAAAAEHASRGKPAYQRTCPFYKIMPGFFICVDAFRYGAVEGCKAYFLSHFHSDHYVGLTANWCHGPIYCSKVTGALVKAQLRTAAKWVKELEFEEIVEVPGTDGVTVTMIPANHCPGSSLFLFQKTIGKGPNPRVQRILHCGDFRACPAHVTHPLLKPEVVDSISGKVRQQKIDICYLDTTYLNPRYSFPPQEDVIRACAELCASISPNPNSPDDIWDKLGRESGSGTVSKFFTVDKPSGDEPHGDAAKDKTPDDRILVICGTYSIGKERICKAIAQALNTKIFASPSKIKICAMLGDPELAALMTSNPIEAQVHMQMLMEIRSETLQDYLDSYKPHFSRIVGFRPSGWNYRPQGAGKLLNANTAPSAVASTQLLHGKAWRSRFSTRDFVPQRGSTREAMCFGVPYSEHSSFRELGLFTMGLRIERIVPTVNVGSEASRKRMKGWVDRWMAERRRGGIVRPLEGEEKESEGDGGDGVMLWEGKDGKGGGAWW
jgi:DNA cross-link repair 1A protein